MIQAPATRRQDPDSPERAHAADHVQRTGQRRVFWWAFLVLMGLSSAWAVATPLMGVPDEPAHVIKAAAVVRGELTGREMPDGGAFQLVTVPAGIGYYDTFGCFAQKKDTPPSCVPPFSGDPSTLVDARTSAGNYNPLYYAVVGLPSLASHGAAAVYGMRLVSALLSCLFLASAFSALSGLRRRKWAITATAVAMTPMVLFLNGAVNPNSLEYATSAALLANLVLLLERSADRTAYRRYVPVITAAACVLANTKGLSLLWLALMAATACILGTWPQIKALTRNAWVWAGTAAIGLSCAFALYWITRHDSLSSNPFEAAGSSPLTGAEIMLDRTFDYATGYVGQFGWLEVPAPMGAFVLWLGLGTALVMAAVVLARGRGRTAAVFLLAALLLLPPLLQAQAVGTIGIVWQGRYILAVFVPLLMVCGMALDRMDARGFSPQAAALLNATAILLAVFHFWTFMQTLRRYVTGWAVDRRWIDMVTEPSWQPPGGTLLSVGAFAAFLALALWLVRGAIRAERRSAEPATAEPSPAA
ncbi:DUF2142 domain-containing protein [Arthrobacter sp. EPSL27]|uniref:DUF2142 domain-containing protein n=1 Tax=Arthrobacter sp. EPSL27 TaxID=1745378 RepID=UPI000747DAEA|nr:DUF2142 domain-containing protein [Arthrobacter sp. EPSL27]KUM38404.1 hypothetical protein AR539_04165 [Arthrobacter sp. EPSL27]